MTAFSVSDIPSTVNTVEKLAVWTMQVLNNLYPSVSYTEAVGQNVRAAQASPYEVTATDPPEYHYYGRITCKLNRAWQQSGKIWEHAIDIGSLSIPSAMKT